MWHFKLFGAYVGAIRQNTFVTRFQIRTLFTSTNVESFMSRPSLMRGSFRSLEKSELDKVLQCKSMKKMLTWRTFWRGQWGGGHCQPLSAYPHDPFPRPPCCWISFTILLLRVDDVALGLTNFNPRMRFMLPFCRYIPSCSTFSGLATISKATSNIIGIPFGLFSDWNENGFPFYETWVPTSNILSIVEPKTFLFLVSLSVRTKVNIEMFWEERFNFWYYPISDRYFGQPATS